MSMQTPKNYQKKSNYTSPIGLLKNYNTVNAPNNTNSYQQQFYRIKAQRLQAELQELKEENGHLKAKIIDVTTANQVLRQKIFVMENNLDRQRSSSTRRTIPSFVTESGYPSGNNSGRQSPSMIEQKYFSLSVPSQKTERSALNSQIQRLAKQNRILKNEHEVQMSKVRDENKKLVRKNIELQDQLLKKIPESESIEQKSYKQKQEERILKIERANNDLRKDHEQIQKQKRKIEQKLRQAEQNNRNLKKENQELRILQSPRGRNDTTIQNLKFQNQKIEKEYKQRIENLQKEIQTLKKQTTTHEEVFKDVQNLKSDRTFVSNGSKFERQNELLKRKLSIYEQNLSDKEQQIKGILIKLKPLLQKQKSNKKQGQQTQGEGRASLSILQIFLKKYKINSF